MTPNGGRKSTEQAVLQRIRQAQQQKEAEGTHLELEDIYSAAEDSDDDDDDESLSYGVPGAKPQTENNTMMNNKTSTGAGGKSVEQNVLQLILQAQRQKEAKSTHLQLEDLYSVGGTSSDDEEEDKEAAAEIANATARSIHRGSNHSNTLAAAGANGGAAGTTDKNTRETRRSFQSSLNAKAVAAQAVRLGGSTLKDEAPAQQKQPSSNNRSSRKLFSTTDLGDTGNSKRKVVLIKKKQVANSVVIKERKRGSSTGRKSPGSAGGAIRRKSDTERRSSGRGEDNSDSGVQRRRSGSDRRSSADSSSDNNDNLAAAAAAAAAAMEGSLPRRKRRSEKRERGDSLGRIRSKSTSNMRRATDNRDHSILTSEERMSEALGRPVPVGRSRSSFGSEHKAEQHPSSINPPKSPSAKSCCSKSSRSRGHRHLHHSSSNDHNHGRHRSSRDSRSVEEESNRRHSSVSMEGLRHTTHTHVRRRKSSSEKFRSRSRSRSRGEVPSRSPSARSTGKGDSLDRSCSAQSPRRRKSGSEKQLLTSQIEHGDHRSSRSHSSNEQAPVVRRKSGSKVEEQKNGELLHRSSHKHGEAPVCRSKSMSEGQHRRPSSDNDHGAPLPPEDKEKRRHHSSNTHLHHKPSSKQTGILRNPSIAHKPSDVEDAPEAPTLPAPQKQPGILRKACIGRASSQGSGSDQQPSQPQVPSKQTLSQEEATQNNAPSLPRSLLKKSSFDQQKTLSSDTAGTSNDNGRPELLRRSSSQDSDHPDDDTRPKQQKKPVSTKRVQDIRKAWESGKGLNEDDDEGSAFEEDEKNNACIFQSTKSKVVKAMERIQSKDVHRRHSKNLVENTDPIGEIIERDEWEDEQSVYNFQDEEGDDMEEPVARPRCNETNDDDKGEQSNFNDGDETGGDKELSEEEDEEYADDEMLEAESTHHSDEGDLLKSSTKKVDSVKKPRKSFEDDEEDDVGSSSFGADFSQYSANDLWKEGNHQRDDNPLMEFPYEITANGDDIPPAEEIESEDTIIMTPLGLESPVIDEKETCNLSSFDNDFGDGDDNEEEISDIESAFDDNSMSGEEEVEEDEEDDEDCSSQHQESTRQETNGRKVQERHDAGGLKVTDYGDFSESESFRREQKLKQKAKPPTRSAKPGFLQTTLKAVIPADECASDDESACLSSFAGSTRRKGEAFDFQPVHHRCLDNSDSEESDRGPIKAKKHGVGRYLARVVKHGRREESDATSVNSAHSKSKRGLLGRSLKRHAQKLNS